jgi:hypothetical protein
MKVSYALGHERENSLLLHSALPILCVSLLTISGCGCVKCGTTLCIADGLRFTVFAWYSWEMTLNASFDVSFDNMWEWKGMWETAGEVNSVNNRW